MGIWIAVFITLAVFGSVMWVMPSPREKALTEMRSRALENGMKVRLLDQKLAKVLFYWLENYRPFTLYERPLPTKDRPASHKAIVVRLSEDKNAHELDARDELKEALSKAGVFDSLPDTCEALVISQGGLAILWIEKQKSLGSLEGIDSIRECLDKCAENSALWL